MEKLTLFLILLNVGFVLALVAIVIIWNWESSKSAQSENNSNTSEFNSTGQILLLPHRHRSVQIDFNPIYENRPVLTYVFPASNQTSTLAVSNVEVQTSYTKADARRGQLEGYASPFKETSFTACDGAQDSPTEFTIYYQSNLVVVQAKFDTVSLEWTSEPKSVLNKTAPETSGTFKVIDHDQFGCINDESLVVYDNGKVETVASTADTDVTVLKGFTKNLVYLNSFGGTGKVQAANSKAWTDVNTVVADTYDAKMLGTYYSSNSFLVFAHTKNSKTFFGKVDFSESDGKWSSTVKEVELSKNYDLTTTSDRSLYISVNNTEKETTICFMSGKSDLVVVRLDINMDEVLYQKEIPLPGDGDYQVVRCNTFYETDGSSDETVQILFAQNDTLQSILLDQKLEITGDFMSVLSGVATEKFVSCDITLHNSTNQMLLRTQASLSTQTDFETFVSPWSPFVTIDAVTEPSTIKI